MIQSKSEIITCLGEACKRIKAMNDAAKRAASVRRESEPEPAPRIPITTVSSPVLRR